MHYVEFWWCFGLDLGILRNLNPTRQPIGSHRVGHHNQIGKAHICFTPSPKTEAWPQGLQGWIVHGFLQAARVRRRHQNDATKADGTSRFDFQGAADFINDLKGHKVSIGKKNDGTTTTKPAHTVISLERFLQLSNPIARGQSTSTCGVSFCTASSMSLYCLSRSATFRRRVVCPTAEWVTLPNLQLWGCRIWRYAAMQMDSTTPWMPNGWGIWRYVTTTCTTWGFKYGQDQILQLFRHPMSNPIARLCYVRSESKNIAFLSGFGGGLDQRWSNP